MGIMINLSELVSMVREVIPAGDPLDGTYVVAVREVSPTDYRSDYTLRRVGEVSGYEVAFDGISPERYGPTEGGAHAYLQVGDRIGIWSHEGVLYVDRTVHVNGPADIAWIIGRETGQLSIWDWANARAINELGEEF